MPESEWGDWPLLLAVDSDARELGRIEGELRRAFGSDFRVRGELVPEDAVRTLRGAHERGERVAVVLVDDAFSAEARAQIFATVRKLHPDARRALLVPWGAWSKPASAHTILRGIAVGDISYYVLKPWISRDEFFHRTIAEFVQEWSRSDPTNPREVVVVAARRSSRGYAVNDLLTRNGIPHAHHDRESDLGRAVLERVGQASGQVVVWMPAIGGLCLVDPTDAEILEAWEFRPPCRNRTVMSICCSWVPVQRGSRLLSRPLRRVYATLVVEQQAIGDRLRSSSLIRNYLGFSRGLSGAELAQTRLPTGLGLRRTVPADARGEPTPS